jgi:hypothetical protein
MAHMCVYMQDAIFTLQAGYVRMSDDRNSYGISSIILVKIYSTLEQLQGKFLKK